jgi:hypothetical protein
MFELPDIVGHALNDLDRICPVAAGLVILTGDSLEVKLADSELDIRAPHSMLADLVRLCDGTRTCNEVIDSAPMADKNAYRELLCGMLGSGAFIDASLYVANAIKYVRMNGAFGRTVNREISRAISQRFGPGTDSGKSGEHTYDVEPSSFDKFVEARKSGRTFADNSLAFVALKQLAWAMAGVIADEHEWLKNGAMRRTIAWLAR